MGRRGGGGVKPKRRKKVLVSPAERMKDGKPTEVYRILEEMIKKHRPDLEEAEIVILWRAGWRADAEGWIRMFSVKKASDVDHARSAKGDFAVLLNKEFWPKLPDRMKTIYMHQILCYMKPLIDSDGEQKQDDKGRDLWRVRKHADVEQFAEVIKEYGEEALYIDKDALAAIKDADRPLLPKDNVADAGTNGQAAGNGEFDHSKGAEWRNWPISVLGEYGLPKGKVKLLEAAFDDRMGKLIDRMNRQGSEDHWFKDIKGFGESGYNALVDAMMALRKARPEFQKDVW